MCISILPLFCLSVVNFTIVLLFWCFSHMLVLTHCNTWCEVWTLAIETSKRRRPQKVCTYARALYMGSTDMNCYMLNMCM